MSISMNRRVQTCTAIALIYGLFNSAWLAAQDGANEAAPLVIVGDGRDAGAVRQIGGTAIQVVAPFSAGDEDRTEEYDHCNSRVQRVRQFTVYLARADASCPHECFWRERLTRENPRGRVQWIVARCSVDEHDCQFAVQKATEVHRVLVTALPEHRQAFDANLATEMKRLSQLRFDPVPFVSVDR